jgi:hypothetical protein
LVTSFEVAGRDRGFDTKQRRAANLAAVRAYREAMHDMAQMRTLDLWYTRLDIDDITAQMQQELKRSQQKRFTRNVAKARTKDSIKAFGKLVRVVDGELRLIGDPPLIVPIGDLYPEQEAGDVRAAMQVMLRSYRRTLPGDHRRLLERFHYVDAARKVVGVGSVGTRAWIVFMLGRDNEDPLFLQAKEAQASVLEPFLGKSKHANHGQRVVAGQRLMQAASDVMLGWLRTDGVDGVSRDFYVRQLWDGKGSALVDVMEPSVLTIYARLCGWTLARAHARSGDPAAIAGYMGDNDRFDQAVAAFAESYADLNEDDYAALKKAVDTGRVTAEVGL